MDQAVKVLIVDDRPEKLIALESVIRDLAQIITADSGKNALRCLMQDDFAVILLDVNMPGMDGFETASLIRKRDRCARTPIIFITSYSETETHASRGYQLGAVDYIHAPIIPDILRAKVAVFVDLFEKTQQIKRQAEERIQLERETAARSIAEAAEKRATFLAEASKILASSFNHADVLQRVAEHCVPNLATLAVFNLLETDNSMRCVAAAGTNAENLDVIRHLQPLSAAESCGNFAVAKVVQTRSPELVNGVSDELLQTFGAPPDQLAQLRGLGIQAYMVVPLVSHDHVQGALLLANTEADRRFNALDLSLAQEFASRAAMAVENSFLYQAAEQANRAKDEFLAIVSHELRTPLTPILGWVRILSQRNVDEALNTRGIQIIERNVRAQTKLIEDLLDVSRIITGKLKLNIQSLDITSVVEAAVDAVRTAADGKSINITTEFSRDNCRTKADPDRLQQAIWNLLTNSIKFTPSGGQVNIAVNTDEHHVRVVVSDTGRGIRKDFLPYVFDRFRQADSSSTRAYGGLGIGLTIVRHIVELHGGIVTAESDGDSRGATFTISLPKRAATHVAAIVDDPDAFDEHMPSVNDAEMAGRQVLIVEDDPDTRDLLTTILEKRGFAVTAVGSARDALEKLDHFKPDVIISDIGMAGEDGYTLLRKIRLRTGEQGGQIPAIALTAYAKDEDRRRALAAGFQHHIAKPLEPEQLIGTIARVIRQQIKVG